jgi:hypothetical protein
MVCKKNGGMPTAALYGLSPPSYTFVNGNLNFQQKNGRNPWFTAWIHLKTLLRTHHQHSTLHHNRKS